ncbi:unnamed protein product [Umbelopsis vinacea]
MSKDMAKTYVANHELFKAIIGAAASERVLPHERKKGYGSALLEHVLSKADEAGLPVYAEITNESAMSLLSHAGFIERGSTLLEKSIQIRILVREPKRNTGASKRLEIRPGRRGSEMSNFS